MIGGELIDGNCAVASVFTGCPDASVRDAVDYSSFGVGDEIVFGTRVYRKVAFRIWEGEGEQLSCSVA